MLKFQIDDLTLEVVDDITYTLNSTDNLCVYDSELVLDGDGSQSSDSVYSSKYCVELRKEGKVLRKVIVIGPYGRMTRVNQESAIIDGNSLILVIGDFICSLSIPSLDINWKVETSCITCFRVLQFDNAFLIHGELEIAKVSRFGYVEWSFSGRDIFVSPEGNREIEIHGDVIHALDWEGNLYKISKDGKLLN